MSSEFKIIHYIKESRDQESADRDFPGGPVVKNPPCNAGDMGSVPESRN